MALLPGPISFWFWAFSVSIFAILGVLGYLRFRYRQIIRGNSFFTKAATVYVLVGEDDAKLAAVASGKGAAAKDREQMREFLTTLSDSFQAQRGAWMKQIERANTLAKEIIGGGALSTEAFEVRDALRRANPDYFKALRTGDAQVFVRRYPHLFGQEAERAILVGDHPDSAAEEMVDEMQAGPAGKQGEDGASEATGS